MNKDEIIKELAKENGIGCSLVLRGKDINPTAKYKHDTSDIVVFDDGDIQIWSDNEQFTNDVYDNAIEKIIGHLFRLSLSYNIYGFDFDSTSKIYFRKSNDYQTNIDAEVIDAFVALMNRDRERRLDYLRNKEDRDNRNRLLLEEAINKARQMRNNK